MRILVCGLGDVGAQVFDFLVRVPGRHTFLVCGRDRASLEQRTNLSVFAAMQLGFTPQVTCAHMDLHAIAETAETIANFHPDVIFNAATLQKWGVVSHLPRPLADQVYQAQIGPWLPIQLTLIYKLMQAIAATGLPIQVVNATYPDVIHFVLEKVGLAPTVGIGDLANNIPALRVSVALRLQVPVEQVDIRLVAGHHVSYWMSRKGHSDGAPFHLSVFVDGVDCTQQVYMSSVFDLLPTQLKRAPGNLMTAVSAAAVFHGLMAHGETITHAPGPRGLPGGYPVRINTNGVQVQLPDTITLSEATRINTLCQTFDGIERVDDDGTVHFAEKNMAIFKNLFGYECHRMRLSEIEYWAEELGAKYSAFARAYRS